MLPDSIAADIRCAVRALWARPAFAVLSVLTLGLGLGANAAIFSAVNSLLLRDPPFEEPDRLVRVASVRGDAGRRRAGGAGAG